MRGVGYVLRRLNNLRILTTGYVPERIAAPEWERLFESGSYDRLESIPERARYSLIVGQCDVLGTRSILDVGCGQGVLAKRLSRVTYDRYVGVDISQAAVDQARRALPDPRNTYLVSDADGFDTADRFDLLVFNECLYYMEDPAAVVRRYLKFLRPGGHVSISMYHTLRSSAVWKLLTMLTTVEAVQIKYEKHASWTVKLMQPTPGQDQRV
jgi:2-polyprenyl-3-methyl-5-hydroxy-6-metoxy-1,4-benzoquinol methylase